MVNQADCVEIVREDLHDVNHVIDVANKEVAKLNFKSNVIVFYKNGVVLNAPLIETKNHNVY